MSKKEVLYYEVEKIPCKASKTYLFFKRIFDIIFAVLAGLILLPLLLVIAICVKIDSKGTVLYRHRRIGKHGKYIYLYKFRTMFSDSDNLEKYFNDEQMAEYLENFKVEDDPRITKLGKFLRKTSLDELPQILNIIAGDMSLIGPRPVLEDELLRYEERLPIFLSVTPGMTGWWACHGRSKLTYAERIELELYYAEHCNILLDIKCFFKTVIGVLKGDGAI